MVAVSVLKTYTFNFTEDALTSQYGQPPSMARRIVNFIPSRALDIKRKAYAPPFADAPADLLGQPYWWSLIQDFIFYIGGTPTRKTIMAWTNNLNTFIGIRSAGGGVANLPIGAYSPPGNAASGWRGDPLILYSDGLLFISDGVESSIFDGLNSRTWSLQKKPGRPTLTFTGGPLTFAFTGTGLNDFSIGPMFDGSVDAMTLHVEIDGLAGVGTPAFTGAGLNDLTIGGTVPTGFAGLYTIKIDGVNAPDTFSWTGPGGTGASNVPITGAAQDLENGITVTFGATNGHTLNDSWSVVYSAVDTFSYKTTVNAVTTVRGTHIRITGAEQVLKFNFKVTFQFTTGHKLGDFWEVVGIGFPCEFFREYLVDEFDSIQKRESMPGARRRFTPAEPGMYVVTLTLPAAQNIIAGYTAGSVDKFIIYASHVDGSTKMFRLATVAAPPVGPYVDKSPFYGEPNTILIPFEPAFRNQPTPHSSIGTKFNNRFALRDPAKQSRIWISGFKEIIEQGGARGNPLEMFPGTQNQALIDDATPDNNELYNLSDFENWVELPDEQFQVRAELWFSDGLVIGTEKSVKTMWGRNPEDPFQIGNTSTYGFGVFGKNSFLVTPHGLVIFTADRRLVLDPVMSASSGDRTSQVIDIGWPKQDELDKTDALYSNRFQMRHHKFGRERDWLVVSYTTQNAIDGGTAHYLIYDFTFQTWLSADDVAAVAVGIVQEDQGFQFLVAGASDSNGTDRRAKVIDGFTSDANTAYAAAATRIGMPATGVETRPKNTLRLALLDLGAPEMWKSWKFLRLYIKPGTPVPTVKIWFDPSDVDNLAGVDGNPGAPDITLSPPATNNDTFDFQQLTTQEYLGNLEMRLNKRIAVQIEIPAAGAAGAVQGLEIIYAENPGITART